MYDLSLVENQIAAEVLSASIKLHRSLGPGLMESVYERALEYEMAKRSWKVERQVPVPIPYEELQFEQGFIADVFVARKVIIEVKAVERLLPIHYRQLLTYLRLSNTKLGLLINYNELRVKDGFKRVVNGL